MAASSQQLLKVRRQDDSLILGLGGEWDIRLNPPGFDELAGQLSNAGALQKVTFTTVDLGAYDSSLISLLLQVHRHCQRAGADFDHGSLPPAVNQLLDMALAVPAHEEASPDKVERRFIHRLGQASLNVVDELLDLFNFLGECLFAFGRLFTGRARFRRRDLWVTMQECGAEALPIVSLISVMIGMILGFVGAYQMAGIGTVIFVANLVAIAMVREMGCLMTGIIMSGRTGAAFAAQLGSMKVNEEIDALKTFGFSPIDFLVLPRMLALIIMMPLLTVYANVVGIVGGALVVCVGYDVAPGQYLSKTIESLNMTNFFMGIAKGAVFGVIIAAAGCLRGMQSGSSASAVGTAATSAVVVSITAIVITDCVFAVITTLLNI